MQTNATTLFYGSQSERRPSRFRIRFQVCIITYNSEFLFIYVICDIGRNHIQYRRLGKSLPLILVDITTSISVAEPPRTLALQEENGYTVDTAESGKEAIEKTNERFYNLALFDIRLPDMEGTKVIANVKDTTPKMRKIMITGFPSIQNAVEALNRGADGYITKPFDMDYVLETVKEQLKKQEEEKKISQGKVTEFIETRVKELEEENPVSKKTR